MIIYKTTNLINGKIYIGQDSNNNPNYIGSGLQLIDAIKKYGKKNFKKEILEHCTKENICKREIYWIKEYNCRDGKIGYNISEGGEYGDTLSNHPNKKEIFDKISKTKKSKSLNEKKLIIEKFRNTNNNKSIEEKEIIFKKRSESKKGQIPWNKGKGKLKISEYKVRIAHNRKAVVQLDLSGKKIKNWLCINDAAINLKLHGCNISKSCKDNKYTCGGFKWKYKLK